MDEMEIQLIRNQLNSQNCRNFMKKNYECTMKSSEESVHIRKEGDGKFAMCITDQQFEEVFKLYSKSIAFAPPNSEDLAYAYGSRSTVLFSMNKYKECIRDIDRSLNCNTSDASLKIQLLCRKVQCLAAVGSSESKKVLVETLAFANTVEHHDYEINIIEESVRQAQGALSCSTLQSIRKSNSPKKTKEITLPAHLAILKKNEFYTENVLNSVAVQFNEIFGRQLVVTHDVKPGEIVYVETPYVNCLNLNNYHNYCSHCFIKTWSSIPCDSCNWCMFCSEECKKSAWANYHDIECITISHLRNGNGINYCDHLSLRCLLMGIKESGSLNKFIIDMQLLEDLIDKCERKQDLSELFDKEGFEQTKFKSLFATCSEVSTEISRKHAINCAKTLIILSKHTSLFGQKLEFEDSKELLKNEDIIFIGTILLRLRKISNRCSHVIQSEQSVCKFHNDWITCKMNNCCSKGACVPVVTSFINHSCNPNVKKCMTSDRKLIIFALQPIKKNSQLLLAYQQPFYEVERPMRYTLIRQSLNYTCDCEACLKNWPTLSEMYKMPRKKPLAYAMTYKKLESELFDENDTLVKSIMYNSDKTQFSQATIIHMQSAMEKALKNLEQPSIVICELTICLSMVFERLYCSGLSR